MPTRPPWGKIENGRRSIWVHRKTGELWVQELLTPPAEPDQYEAERCLQLGTIQLLEPYERVNQNWRFGGHYELPDGSVKRMLHEGRIAGFLTVPEAALALLNRYDDGRRATFDLDA